MGSNPAFCRFGLALVGAFLLFTTSAFAQEFSPAPLSVPPVMAPTPRAVSPAPTPQAADTHVESTELGFQPGTGPAVGRTVSYRHKLYVVTDIRTVGGGPAFSGGSKFAIAPAGRRLSVGLKAVDPEKLAALGGRDLSFN